MMSDKFDELSILFLKERDDNLIPEIFKLTIEKTRVWMRIQKTINMNEFSSDFKNEVALTYMSRLYDNTITNDPYKILFSIAKNICKKTIFSNVSDSINSGKVITNNVNEKFIAYEYINEQLKDLPQLTISTLIYIANFPDSIKRMLSLYSDDPNFYIGLIRLFKIKNNFFKLDTEIENIDTNMSKGLLLSSLFKHDPALVVMFLLFKDISMFIQFCTLFGGKSIKIPDISKLKKTIKEVNSLSKKFKNNEKITDKNLLMFTTEIKNTIFKNNSLSITPIIEIFFQRSIESLVKNYEKLQNKLIENVDTCSHKEVSNIYKLLNKESSLQFTMFQSIINSMEFVKSLENLSGENNEKNNDR